MDDICICKEFYEGSKCDSLKIQKFIGDWKGKEIYRYDNYNDTVAVNWNLSRIINSTQKIKMTRQDNAVIETTLWSNGTMNSLDEVTLDSLHYTYNTKLIMNKTKDTITYGIRYIHRVTNSLFYGFGTLTKQ
jgi:hypothetical protein